MPYRVFSNNAKSTVAVELSAVGTTLTLVNGDSFPAVDLAGNGTYSLLTLANAEMTQFEIVRVTEHIAASEVFTIERAFEQYGAAIWPVDTVAFISQTAASANDTAFKDQNEVVAGDWAFSRVPNTADDSLSTPPLNFLYTDAQGRLRSAPYAPGGGATPIDILAVESNADPFWTDVTDSNEAYTHFVSEAVYNKYYVITHNTTPDTVPATIALEERLTSGSYFIAHRGTGTIKIFPSVVTRYAKAGTITLEPNTVIRLDFDSSDNAWTVTVVEEQPDTSRQFSYITGLTSFDTGAGSGEIAWDNTDTLLATYISISYREARATGTNVLATYAKEMLGGVLYIQRPGSTFGQVWRVLEVALNPGNQSATLQVELIAGIDTFDSGASGISVEVTIVPGNVNRTLEVSTTPFTLLPIHANKYLRFTGAGAKSVVVSNTLPIDQEFQMRVVAGSGNVTLTTVGGMAIAPPKGGTLVMEPGDSAVLKIITTVTSDLIGSTQAAV